MKGIDKIYVINLEKDKERLDTFYEKSPLKKEDISILKAIKCMFDNNIIHGDLKSCNLVAHEEGSNLYIKVIDYGSCFHVDNPDENIKLDRVVGTNGFYAPEQSDNILNHKS